MAFVRGSILIYIGYDLFIEFMLMKKLYIDLCDYDSFEVFVVEFEVIVSDELRYNEYTSWRYDYSSTWFFGFCKFL